MNRTRTGFSLALLAAVILLLSQVFPATAQEQGPYDQGQYDQGQNNDQDPPTRAGRLGFAQGSVSFQPAGQGDWVDAVPNRPLTTGDNLWADRDSRAEVQIGSTSIRLSAETSLTFLDLEDNVTQIRLSVGSLFFRVKHIHEGETFEIDTPNLAFTVDQPGEYRLDVDQNGDQTNAIVWHGDAEITGGGNSYRLAEGQQGSFSGTDQLTYDVGGIQSDDDFDHWALSRDQREDNFRSRQYVSEDMTGYEDLDDYGQWRNVDGYGEAWVPSGVAADWAPYRYGHWAFVGSWGWSWVEDEPWGFAPFHYGRWANAGGGWCWVPGPVVAAPVYSPALVAFVGGAGFSIGAGVGIGWFPLGPGEVFVPWYHTSPRYVQNINVTNTRVSVTQVTNVYNNVTVNHVTNVTYINQRVNNSVTVVNRDTFVNARPVNSNIVRVDQRQLASARVGSAAVTSFQPQRQSVMGVGKQVRNAPPQAVMSRAVVATHQPVMRRPNAAVAGFSRPAPPPVRTVRAAPAAQAQPLQRGARGGPPNAGRPGAPANNNRGAEANTPRPGENRAPENNAGRPGENAPRPGAENNNARPENAPRPGAENNPSTGRPDNNGGRNVPRPPSAQGERPGTTPEQQRGNPGANRPDQTRPETPRTAPEQSSRPENRQTSPSENQREAAPPDNKHEVTPPPENRGQSAPRPETRTEPAPRPEARPASPPKQETKPPKPEKAPKEQKKEDKKEEPPK